MFIIHPIFQSLGIVIALYAFVLGVERFRFLHLKQKARFKWKLHVRLGIAANSIWLMGIFGGLYTVKTSWSAFFVTGLHARTGILMIPFILFALGTGIYMDRNKKKRANLPLIHGICNTILLLLALFQIYTGIYVYRTFVLGL